MIWAYIDKDNNVTEHPSLPENWNNFSNFFALASDIGFLNTIGWYELVENTEPLSTNQQYGQASYNLDNNINKVVKTVEIIPEPPPNPVDVSNQRESFLRDLRSQRDYMLQQSDWTQLGDVIADSSTDWVSAWKNYRQKLRDLPAVYSASPYSDVISLNQVDWPAVPSINRT